MTDLRESWLGNFDQGSIVTILDGEPVSEDSRWEIIEHCDGLTEIFDKKNIVKRTVPSSTPATLLKGQNPAQEYALTP